MSPNSSSKLHNPNEHLKIPTWINEDYFLPILEKNVPNFSKIKSFSTIAATGPGENYTSVMVRVVMDIELKDGTTQDMSYILKTCLEASDGAAMISSMNLFPKEKQMYQSLLPKFTQLYKDVGVNIKLGPDCLHVEETPEKITLVMEDLKRQNYANLDRLKGLDLAQMKQVLRRLAELHAASVVYYELNGKYDEIYYQSFFTEENAAMFEAMADQRKEIFNKAMRQWGLEDAEKYIARTPSNQVLFAEAMRIFAVDPNAFNVLNHGDCWVNNFMFRHNEDGTTDDLLFVDFQVGKWGTPAQDLWYLIVSSAALDIKIEKFDHFIQIYHQRLVECLQLLKYSKHVPTLKQMHITMLEYGYFGPFTANGVLSAILLPADKDANIDNMMKPGAEGDEFRYKIFTNPYYAKAQCQLYPFFDNKGVLL